MSQKPHLQVASSLPTQAQSRAEADSSGFRRSVMYDWQPGDPEHYRGKDADWVASQKLQVALDKRTFWQIQGLKHRADPKIDANWVECETFDDLRNADEPWFAAGPDPLSSMDDDWFEGWAEHDGSPAYDMIRLVEYRPEPGKKDADRTGVVRHIHKTAAYREAEKVARLRNGITTDIKQALAATLEPLQQQVAALQAKVQAVETASSRTGEQPQGPFSGQPVNPNVGMGGSTMGMPPLIERLVAVALERAFAPPPPPPPPVKGPFDELMPTLMVALTKRLTDDLTGQGRSNPDKPLSPEEEAALQLRKKKAELELTEAEIRIKEVQDDHAEARRLRLEEQRLNIEIKRREALGDEKDDEKDEDTMSTAVKEGMDLVGSIARAKFGLPPPAADGGEPASEGAEPSPAEIAVALKNPATLQATLMAGGDGVLESMRKVLASAPPDMRATIATELGLRV